MKKRKTAVSVAAGAAKVADERPAAQPAARGRKKATVKNESEMPMQITRSDDLVSVEDSSVISYSKPFRSVTFTPAGKFATINPTSLKNLEEEEEENIRPFHARFSDFQASQAPGHLPDDAAVLIRRLNFTTKDCQTPGRYDARQKAVGAPMQVYLRIRPVLEFDRSDEEIPSEGSEVIRLDDESSITLTAPIYSAAYRSGEKESKFTFNKVFNAETPQEEIFNTAVLPLVDAFYAKGTNGLIFAYGITNSGKSYTMQGTPTAPGIIPRVICSVFEKIFTNQKNSSEDSLEGLCGLLPHFSITVSFLEIYNERIFDLLAQQRLECKLQHTKTDEVYVTGLKEISISNHKEALLILQQGLQNRKVGETLLNSDSSRSHSVFTIKLLTSDGSVWSRLSIVDLAGSERTKRTLHNETAAGASKMREAVNINTSLLVLGRCLESLRWNQLHPKQKPKQVPFRESKITRLFRDALTGWGRTVMICNSSQTAADYDENVHALKYAAIAREIRVMPRVDSTNPAYLAAQARQKRLAEKPLAELDLEQNSSVDDLDVELNKAIQRKNRPATVGDDEDGDAEVDALLDQIFHLKQLLVATEAKCGEIDTIVRTECVNEMEAQAKQLEEFHDQNVQYEKDRLTQLYERKFAIFKQEMEEKMKSGQSQEGPGVLTAAVEFNSLQMELDNEKSRLAASQAALTAKQEEIRQLESKCSQQARAHEEAREAMKTLWKEQSEKEIQLAKKENSALLSAHQALQEKFAALETLHRDLKDSLDDKQFHLNQLERLCEEFNHWKGNNLSLTEFLVQMRGFLFEEEKEISREGQEKENSQFSKKLSFSNAGESFSAAEVEGDGEQVDLDYIALKLNDEATKNSIARTQPVERINIPNNNIDISKTAPPMNNQNQKQNKGGLFASPAPSSSGSFIAAALAVLTKKKKKIEENPENFQQQAEDERELEKQRKAQEKAEKAPKKQAEKEEKERLKAEQKARQAEERERKKREKEASKGKKEENSSEPVKSAVDAVHAEWLNLLSPIHGAPNGSSPNNALVAPVAAVKYGKAPRHRQDAPAFMSQSSIPFSRTGNKEDSFTFYDDPLEESVADQENEKDKENKRDSGREKRGRKAIENPANENKKNKAKVK